MKTQLLSQFIAAVLLVSISPVLAAPPPIISYQGRVAVGNVNFTGTGQFKFALVNGAGLITYWSNDGTSVAGSQPTSWVTVNVASGLYTLLLGDTGITNMTTIPAGVFANSDVRVRVWFNDGTHGFQQLPPDSRVASNGYAFMASTVPDGSITSAKIATGAVGAAQIAAGSLTSDKLDIDYAKFVQEEPPGTQAGSASSEWTKRKLNKVVESHGSSVGLDTNTSVVTLQPGVYLGRV